MTMGRLAKLTCALGALLALGGCAMETANEEDVAPATAAEEDLLIRGIVLDPPTRLTLYSEAGLWGTSLDAPLAPNGDAETIRLITTTEIQSAGLLGRISSLRLSCGSRDGYVVLFNAYNTSTTGIGSWSEYATGHTVSCAAGETVTVNLHTQAAGFADRVASVYFVRHAREIRELNLSWLVTSFWNAALEDAPSGADPDGDPRLRMRSNASFDIRQDFQLDSFWCEERHGHFVLRAQMYPDGSWNAFFVSRYVDTGTGDYWGCRSEMEAALQAGAIDAAQRLEDGLNDDLMPLAGDHPRHYLVPFGSLREFLLMSGGDPVEPPVVHPGDFYDARGI